MFDRLAAIDLIADTIKAYMQSLTKSPTFQRFAIPHEAVASGWYMGEVGFPTKG